MGYISKGNQITLTEEQLVEQIGVLGTALQYLRVNSAGTGLEYATFSINGLISAGSNITLTGSGTVASPYVIASSGGSGSGTVGPGTINEIAYFDSTTTIASL